MNAVYYGVLLVWTIAVAFGGLLGLAIWIFKSWSVYQIASRRGLANAWLSWIPVGHEWIIGSISDQYQYLVCGKVAHKRKLLLGFSAVSFVGSIVTLVMMISLITELGYMASFYPGFEYHVFGKTVGLSVVMVISAAVGLVAFIFRCICKYDVYRSCDPKNAVAYLVMGIIFVILDPIFMWICRNKDLGMPPRKPEYQTYVDPQNPTYL